MCPVDVRERRRFSSRQAPDRTARDCHGREAVLSLLRERASEGAGAAEIELIEAGEDAIVTSRVETVPDGPAAGLRPATLIVFRDGLAVQMRQFRNREEALAAA